VPVVVEGVAVRDLRVDAADGEVHLGEAPGGVVGLLAVDRDVAELAGVGLDELLALHEHAARAAAGVVDAALVRGEHLDQHAHHVRGRVELAAALALGAGEAREEVLVHAAERVARAVGRAAERDVADQVDDLAQALLVETRPGVVLGQHALSEGLSRSMAAIASSTSVPMVGCGALAFRCCQRASFGTQKMLAARYSSRSSGSAPWAFCASSSACLASKASEMYLRKIRPRTTCLYSAASMLLRNASAAAQSLASKPIGAGVAVLGGGPCHRVPYRVMEQGRESCRGLTRIIHKFGAEAASPPLQICY
jgi:hypothetical protein